MRYLQVAISTDQKFNKKGKLKMIEMIRFTDKMPEVDEIIITTPNKGISGAAFFRMQEDDDGDYYLCNIYSGEEVGIDGSEYWGYVPEFRYPVDPEPAPTPTSVSGYKIVNGIVVKA